METYRGGVFGRLRAWGRSHTAAVDALWVVPYACLCLLNTAVPSPLVLTPALVLPLIWRRKWPRAVFALIALVSFVQWLADVQVMAANAAVVVAMYTVASRCPLRWAVAAGLVTELGLLLTMEVRLGSAGGPFFTASALNAAIWISGIYANTRHRYLKGLEERAERAERERDQQARIAAAAERARIARELHDVIAHNVSVMVVQADGANFAIDTDPEEARRAVRTISVTGRRALAEMRKLVGVLRQDDGTGEDYAPQPSLAELPAMVERVRAMGLPVDLRVCGTPVDLPQGEQLAMYRIVQEALTNTIKHGGPEARASVLLEYGPREVTVTVADNGRGAAPPPGAGGHGLVGMRERVAMYGGSLSAGPRPGGGFQVRARLPVGGGDRVA